MNATVTAICATCRPITYITASNRAALNAKVSAHIEHGHGGVAK